MKQIFIGVLIAVLAYLAVKWMENRNFFAGNGDGSTGGGGSWFSNTGWFNTTNRKPNDMVTMN